MNLFGAANERELVGRAVLRMCSSRASQPRLPVEAMDSAMDLEPRRGTPTYGMFLKLEALATFAIDPTQSFRESSMEEYKPWGPQFTNLRGPKIDLNILGSVI